MSAVESLTLVVSLLLLSPYIQVSGAPSPTKLRPTRKPTAKPSKQGTDTQVFIGGAGFAGISAAQEFHNAKVKFWIAEASDRVGGRMFGGFLNKTGKAYHVEYGANWVQGLAGNPIWTLSQKYGLAGSLTNFDNLLVYDDKGRLNYTESDFESGSNCARAADAYYGLEKLNSFCLSLGEGDPFPSQSAKKFCLKVLGANFKPADDNDVSCQKGENITTGFNPRKEKNPAVARVCEWYFLDFEHADVPRKLSTKGAVSADLTSRRLRSDANYFVTDKRGYKWVVESTGAKFLSTSKKSQSEIIFNDRRLNLQTKVVKVEWDPKGRFNVKVTLCRTKKVVPANSPILYPCVANARYITVTAKYFLSTFSLGVLKASVALELNNKARQTLKETRDVAPVFVPPLSSVPALAKAIPAIGYALLQKIFFQFPFTFWPQGVELFLTAYANGTWVGDFAPGWLSVDLHNKSDSRYFPGSKALVLFVSGARAIELSSLSDSAIIAKILPVLNLMFGKSIKAANGGKLLSRKSVLDFYLYRWHSDPLYRGAYSSNFVNAPLDLLGDRYGNLAFSGEVTCHNLNGYVHGAYLGGIRSARLLLSQKFGINGLNLNSACDA